MQRSSVRTVFCNHKITEDSSICTLSVGHGLSKINLLRFEPLCLAPGKGIPDPLLPPSASVFEVSSHSHSTSIVLLSFLLHYADDDTPGRSFYPAPCEQVDRTAPNHGFTVNRVAFNPGDHNFLTTSGPMHLRLWYAASDNILKAYAILPQAREQVMALPRPTRHARTACFFCGD